MFVRILFLAIILLVSTACEKKPTANADPAASSSSEAQTTKVSIQQLEAELKVLEALQAAMADTVHRSQDATTESRLKKEEFLKPESQNIAFLFSSNNHGERIDCGCKKRPLGGLARRKTMIALADSSDEKKRQEWWGDVSKPDLKFVVDSGDMFYKSELVSTGKPTKKAQADYDAESVAIGMAKLKYDAVNVGILDFAISTERTLALYEKAGIKPISANVYRKGELLFDPYRIVERGGLKVAFIGVTREKPREPKYYTTRQLSVSKASDELNKWMPQLRKEADLVVVLSNLGLPDTQKQLTDVTEKPDLVILSGTNRMTRTPTFVDGVPLVEPMSQGKYFGRVDVVRNGSDKISFANSAKPIADVLTQYGRAWRNYLGNRIRLNRGQREIAELEYEIAARKETTEPKEKTAAEVEKSNSKENVKQLSIQKSKLMKAQKRLEVLSRGRISSAERLQDETRVFSAAKDQKVGGDDFISTHIAAVDIKVPEASDVKRVISQREKKRPE